MIMEYVSLGRSGITSAGEGHGWVVELARKQRVRIVYIGDGVDVKQDK